MKIAAALVSALLLGACQSGGRSNLVAGLNERNGPDTTCAESCGSGGNPSAPDTPANAGTAGQMGSAGAGGTGAGGTGAGGTDTDGPPALISQLTTYGAEPEPRQWLEGSAAFVAEDRVVFLESTRHTSSRAVLVQLGPTSLTRLGEAETRVAYSTHRKEPPQGFEKANTRIVALNETHFAVVGSHLVLQAAGIEVFEITSNELVSRGFTELPLGEPGIIAFGATARSDALWICGMLASGKAVVRSFRLNAAGWTYTQAGEFPVQQCNGLALDPGGQSLFIAGSGVQSFDVRAPEQLVPVAHALADQQIEDVQVNEEYVAALRVEPHDGFGEALVLRVEELRDAGPVPLLRLAPPPGTSGAPIGIALNGNRLLAEWMTIGGDPTFVATAHALDRDGAPALAQWSFRQACCGGERSTFVTPVARGNFSVLQPWRRVLRLDEGAGRFTAITGTAHGSMRSVVSVNESTLVTLGPYSSHRIDLTDPKAPRVSSGGMNLPVGTADHQLVITGSEAAPQLVTTVAGPFDALVQNSEDTLFTMLDVSVSPPRTLGSFFVRGAYARLGMGAGYLFQVLPDGYASYRVRRFATREGIGREREHLAPDWETVLEDELGVDLTHRSAWGVGIAPSGDEVLIVQSRFSTGPEGKRGYSLLWARVTPAGHTLLAEALLDADEVLPGLSRLEVALAGNHALVLGDRGVTLLRREGSMIRRVASRGNGDSLVGSTYQRILSFDAQRVSVARHRWLLDGATSAARSTWNVDVLRAADLSPLVTYETPDDVRSLGVAGSNLVFGMNTGIAIATPMREP
jgi:hypothetical protein